MSAVILANTTELTREQVDFVRRLGAYCGSCDFPAASSRLGRMCADACEYGIRNGGRHSRFDAAALRGVVFDLSDSLASLVRVISQASDLQADVAYEDGFYGRLVSDIHDYFDECNERVGDAYYEVENHEAALGGDDNPNYTNLVAAIAMIQADIACGRTLVGDAA